MKWQLIWIFFVINLIITIIVLAAASWLAGRALAGANAKFLDSVWIIILGNPVGGIILIVIAFIPGFV